MKSLGYKLTLAVICGLLLSIIITVGISVFISSNVITDGVLNKIELNTESEANNLNSWLSAHQANMSTLANVLSAFEELDKDVIQPILSSIMNDNESYLDVFMGLPDNTAFMGSGVAVEELYDWWRATERGWYQIALTDITQTHITPPYVDSLTGELCLTVSRAVIHDGRVMGVVGADILLNDMRKMVEAITFNGTGYTMLVDANGDVLLHPGEFSPTASGEFFNMRTMANGIYASLWSHINRSTETLLATDSAGVEKYYTSSLIYSTDWHLVGILKKSVTTQPIIGLLTLVIPITVVIIAFVAIFIYLIVSHLVSKPLKQLTSIAENVANGNLNVNIDTSATDETGELARSFVGMAAVINSLVREINDLGRVVQVDGDIDARLDTSHFSNSYLEVVKSVNNIIDGLINEVIGLMLCLSKFGDGEFDADIPKHPGKKIVMNQTLDRLRNNLKTIDKDVKSLVLGAIEGDLSHRVDASGYKGDWADMMNDLNLLMEAVITPINEASKVLSYVSEGNFNHTMSGNYKGSFLTIKESINSTVKNIASYINEISKILGALADDDLNQDIKREYVGKFQEIKITLLNIIEKFNNVISSFSTASDQVASGAKLISESSMGLATGATQQAASVEELSATIANINENTVQNAESAKEANDLSISLKNFAEKGNKDMENMLDSMNEIKESSDKISKIIKVIEDIAFQTNLLALNAAVEAARAGEHGKGFAVVAEEVRSLAGRTQVSAKETAELIEEAINRINSGTKIANQTDDALKSIVNGTADVADIISNISKSSDEQALSIGQVMIGINQITDVVQNNSAVSEESASAAQELASQSDVLRGMTSVFNLKK
ncbi:MAG: methyl-accepting chemotaxis protein [Defluviitaleaceae bacterium]|nr:methyl-accepting chemotaxis protein [Defluviitaleaceae bacterium]